MSLGRVAGMLEVAFPDGTDLRDQARALVDALSLAVSEAIQDKLPEAPVFADWFRHDEGDIIHLRIDPEDPESDTHQHVWSVGVWTPKALALQARCEGIVFQALALSEFIPAVRTPQFIAFSEAAPRRKEYPRGLWVPGMYSQPDIPAELRRIATYVQSSALALNDVLLLFDQMFFSHFGAGVMDMLGEDVGGGQIILRGANTLGTWAGSSPLFDGGPVTGDTNFARWGDSVTALQERVDELLGALTQEKVLGPILQIVDVPVLIISGIWAPFRKGTQTQARDEFYAEHGNVPGPGGKRKPNQTASTDRLHTYGPTQYAWWRDIIVSDEGVVGLRSQFFTSVHSAQVAYYARPQQIFWVRREPE